MYQVLIHFSPLLIYTTYRALYIHAMPVVFIPHQGLVATQNTISTVSPIHGIHPSAAGSHLKPLRHPLDPFFVYHPTEKRVLTQGWMWTMAQCPSTCTCYVMSRMSVIEKKMYLRTCTHTHKEIEIYKYRETYH